jgi:hypothetical protein
MLNQPLFKLKTLKTNPFLSNYHNWRLKYQINAQKPLKSVQGAFKRLKPLSVKILFFRGVIYNS